MKPLVGLLVVLAALAGAPAVGAAGWQGSFDSSYQQAASGETICVPPGSYPAQQIQYNPAITSPVTFDGDCSGNSRGLVSVASMLVGQYNGGPQTAFLTVKDMSIDGSGSARALAVAYGNTSPGSRSHDVTFDNIGFAVGKATSGPVIEAFNVLDFTIENSTVGPACCGMNASGVETGSPVGIRIGTADRVSLGWPNNENVVIRNNLIQGITRQCSQWLTGYGSCPQPTCPNARDLCHADAIQVYGAINLTVSGNRIYHNEINGLFLDSTDPEVGGTIANNMIGDVIGGATCFDIDGRGIFGVWNVINNTCAGAGTDQFSISWASAMQSNGAVWNWKGNLGSIAIANSFTPSGCTGGTSGVFTFSYNTWSTVNGGATGCGGNETVGDPTFVNTALAPATTMNLHLADPSGPAYEKIPPTACATNVDIDGQGRPQGTNCEAGADEWGGVAPPPPPPPPPPSCSGSGGTSALPLTKLSETASTITLGWTPVLTAIGYRFVTSASPSKYSNTNDPLRSSVKFSKIAAGGCYYVLAQMPGAGGGYRQP